jgi:CRISPR-associated protein Cas5d
MCPYPVSVEIAGPAALFVRPDSGASFVTYPAPTFSAVQGILDCIARWKSAYLEPERVEICSPIQTMRFVCNYGGPLRKKATITKDSGYQLYSTILVDVCYKIHAVVRESSSAPDAANHLHALQEMFYRRLKQGKLHRTPCLGWSEMTPTYLGPLRDSTRTCTDIDLEIPSMLHRVFDHPCGGRYMPEYRRAVRIEKGVLHYAERT